jgi:hypothetical protein
MIIDNKMYEKQPNSLQILQNSTKFVKFILMTRWNIWTNMQILVNFDELGLNLNVLHPFNCQLSC